MLALSPENVAPVSPPARDHVAELACGHDPYIVSLSDVHGYLGAARSALGAVGEHPELSPVVSAGDDRRLHWAGGDDYVLVFNGDLVDRGPDSEGVLAMVERLAREAPPGHVRVTLGNHEWGALFSHLVGWDAWYSGKVGDGKRRQLCGAIEHGHVVAAYGGYNFTYAHAGLPEPYDPEVLNDRLAETADRLADSIETGADARVQATLVEEYPRVLGLGNQGGRGPGAGIAWLGFEYLGTEAPPQIVGHTRQEQPVQRGPVVCENVIDANGSNSGGEAILVETPERLVSLERTFDGEVYTHEFEVPPVDERTR